MGILIRSATVKSTRNIANGLLFVCTALLFAACTNQMQPAQNALANINVTLDSVSADAKKYIPDQLAAVQSKVAELQASFDKKDYAGVLNGAQPVLAEAQGLASAAAAKKDEIEKALGSEWRELDASVPQLVEAVSTRVDALSKTKHIPKNIDLTAGKSGLADASTQWATAQSAFKSGNFADAVSAAKDAKTKAESAATALQLKLPETGK
jgi:hypothetical protein